MLVLEHAEPAALPGADEQILIAVAIDSRTSATPGPSCDSAFGQQELPIPVVERVFDVRVAAELRRRVLEQRRSLSVSVDRWTGAGRPVAVAVVISYRRFGRTPRIVVRRPSRQSTTSVALSDLPIANDAS